MLREDRQGAPVTDARSRKPKTAMVLAAGLGQRMLPITRTLPKPLIRIGGKTLIDFTLDRLGDAGIEKVVVNVHHLADQVEAHLRARRDLPIVVSDERDTLLETGGGLKRALPLIGDEPFMTFNSDSLWMEGPQPNLRRLIDAWDAQRMDILMLLALGATSVGYEGRGDLNRDAEGRLSRRA